MSKYQVHQIDGNAKEIIDVLEAGGFSVIGLGRPVDIAAGKHGRSFLIEIKKPKAKLRATQEKFIANWRGHVAVLRSVEDAREFIIQHG